MKYGQVFFVDKIGMVRYWFTSPKPGRAVVVISVKDTRSKWIETPHVVDSIALEDTSEIAPFMMPSWARRYKVSRDWMEKYR